MFNHLLIPPECSRGQKSTVQVIISEQIGGALLKEHHTHVWQSSAIQHRIDEVIKC